MEYSSKWTNFDPDNPLGKGAQGTVYLVREKSKLDNEDLQAKNLRNSLMNIRSGSSDEFQYIKKFIVHVSQNIDSKNHFALKFLNDISEAVNPEAQEVRIKNEIQAMADIDHPNLLKLRDHDPEGKWFVSEYHPRRTVEQLSKYV